MSIHDLAFSTASVLIGILAIAIPIWRARQRYALRWATLPPKSMMEIADEIAASIAISYEGRHVANLIRYQFILHNTGFAPLEESAIVNRITWKGPGPILSAKVVATDPSVDLQLENDGPMLEVSWILFNQRCKAIIEVLCEGNTATDSDVNIRGHLSGQIKYVPKIEEKQIWGHHEDDIIRQIQANMAMQNPRARMFSRIFANRWFLRSATWMNYGALVFLAVMFVSSFLVKSGASLVVSATAIFATVALATSLIYLFRNPYAKILRKVKQRGRGA